MSTVHVPSTGGVPSRAPRPQPRREERPDLRIVERRRRRPSRRRIVSVLAISAFTLILFMAVAGHVMILQQQQRIDRLNQQSRQEQATYNRLRLQVDDLQAPSRIVEQALHLGLVQPGQVHWLTPTSSLPSNTAGSTGPTDGDSGDYPQVKPFLGTNQ